MPRILKDYPDISLRQEQLEAPVDFNLIFGSPGAVHVEIGSGKGTFLLNQAQENHEINFLGIEWASKYYRHAVDRIGRWGLMNVRIIRTDAAVLIADFIADSSVECFHVYFPDPWPKKKHHKRRFINNSNFKQLLRCLKSGGQIRIATDHNEYFEQVASVLSEYKDVAGKIEFLPTAGASEGEWAGTNFERKYLKENRAIYTIAVQKI